MSLQPDAILDAMPRQGWLQPIENWRPQREELYERHVDSLDYGYFIRGEEHLHGLRLWTHGRARSHRSSPGEGAASRSKGPNQPESSAP